MFYESAVTIAKMLESVPEQLRDQVVEHVREYIADLKDEMLWNNSFAKTQDKLTAAAKQVRKEIKEGKAVPLDADTL
jgi:lipoate-protein ligase A